eukprot:Sspe_Gene.76768::Locus_47961_Transcript_1_2_Confidence_0.667_Length_1111::g.76768::m.76768
MGFVEEVEDHPATPPPRPPVNPSNPLRLRGRSRMSHWAISSLRHEADRRLLRRFFALLWGGVLQGRRHRQHTAVGELTAAAEKRRIADPFTSWQTWAQQRYEKQMAESTALKERGNQHFAAGEYPEAAALYTEALEKAPERAKEARAVYYANRAACRLKEGKYREADDDCTAALALNGSYIKALARRMQACEHLGEEERCYDDAQAILKHDPNNRPAKAVAARLGPAIEEKRKKQMDEAMETLKGFGNTILGKFGLSLDNFKTTKNPD